MPVEPNKIFLLELNEINFDFVKRYGARGGLPNLNALMEKHGLIETESEQRYEELEPWIQWVTAHSGKSFAQHGVFRLGDIVDTDIHQIWEFLESHGLKVGAVSPMNAANRTRDAAFFVPDPWTKTDITGGRILTGLSEAISQAVNDNAQSRISPRSAFWLAMGLLRYARLGNAASYARIGGDILRRKSWAKAQLLEELLIDVTLAETRRTSPNFVSLFLNAGAHVQHHYMFNSAVYDGSERNPDWVVGANEDPVFQIYAQYDRAVGRIMRDLDEFRLVIATGLHQDPYPETLFYWRLKDHADFLQRMGLAFDTVEPRMSRDFLVRCASAEQAQQARNLLAAALASDGTPLFEIDLRGDSLFVMLTYPGDIPADLGFSVESRDMGPLRPHTAFVAIKNGEHNGVGYVIDTAASMPAGERLPLSHLPSRIAQGFGLQWPQAA